MTRMIVASATVLIMAAGMAAAKGHDQGSTDVPGMDVGGSTVAAAHTLGGAKGNRPEDKGPKANSPATSNAGR